LNFEEQVRVRQQTGDTRTDAIQQQANPKMPFTAKMGAQR
jgi:hypothetical protein